MAGAARQMPLLCEHRFRWTGPEQELWRKPRRLSVTEWAEAHVKLPPSVTSMSGYFRCALTPYLREPMDAWALPTVRRTVFCAGPQTGKTLSAYLPLFYAMQRAPGPALLVMSGQDGAKKVVKDYLTPILYESPALRRLLSPDPDDTTAYRIKLANGMRLYAAWATSPALLKTFPARYGIGDEVDDWPHGAGTGRDAGDPEALFDVRLRTYPFTSKLALVSSPNVEGGVWGKMAGCQVVHAYLARCPECGVEQRMVWRNPAEHGGKGGFSFDARLNPARIEGERLAVYVCAGCGSHWDDFARDRAVRDGRWSPVAPEYVADPELRADPIPKPPEHVPARPISLGYHLPAWYSRLVPLSKTVADFLRAHREPDPGARIEKLRAWTNNHPALPWIETPPAPVAVEAVLALRDERPEGTVPGWALALILTADVQEDGIWYELRAWGLVDQLRTSALVRHGFLARAFGGDFDALGVLLAGTWPGPDGEAYRVRFGLVDSGYRTDEVYEFCRTARRLAPSKGYETRRVPLGYSRVDVIPGTGKAIPGGLQRVDVDTTYFKTELARVLQVRPGNPGAWHLHSGTDQGYARQYTSEAWDPHRGRWMQRGRQPNHLWDCGVLQLAAAQILDTQGLFARPAAQAPVCAPAAPGQLPRIFQPTRL